MNQIIRTNDHETIIFFFLIEAAYNKENRRNVSIDTFGLVVIIQK